RFFPTAPLVGHVFNVPSDRSGTLKTCPTALPNRPQTRYLHSQRPPLPLSGSLPPGGREKNPPTPPPSPTADTMRGLQTEYILKGIYLGLLFYLALHVPDWQTLGVVALCTFGGLALGLGAAAGHKLAQGYRVGGRVLSFLLFLLLESPGLVYAGIL